MKISSRIIKSAGNETPHDASFGTTMENIYEGIAGGASIAGGLTGGVGTIPGAIGGGIYGLMKSLYDYDPPKYEEESKGKIQGILQKFFAGGSAAFDVSLLPHGDTEDISTVGQAAIVNSVFLKIKDGNLLTAKDLAAYFSPLLDETPENILSNPGTKGLFAEWPVSKRLSDVSRDINQQVTIPYFVKKKVSEPTPAAKDDHRSISTRPSTPQAMTVNCIEESSVILKDKGYLETVETSWTPAFDKAFREFIDATTAVTSGGKDKTNLVGGESWTDVAAKLQQSPDLTGACNAVHNFSTLGPSKTPGSGAVATTSGNQSPGSTKDPEGVDVLATIISAMYNEKLVGTPGLDLIKEVKRVQSLVNAVGGANPAGFSNASKVILRRNPALSARLPKALSGPVDKTFAFANKSLFETIQVTINSIYDAGTEGSKGFLGVNPDVSHSAEAIRKYLMSQAGGNWKMASSTEDKIVKAANDRKLKIRAVVASEMIPEDMAAARRIKVTELANER